LNAKLRAATPTLAGITRGGLAQACAQADAGAQSVTIGA
jgi:hypothetical protein